MAHQIPIFGALPDQGSAQDFLGMLERFSGVGYWYVDLPNAQLFWSNQVCVAHGMPSGFCPDSVEDAIQFYHPDDRDLVTASINRSIENHEPFKFTARLQRRDGENRWIRVNGEARTDESGKPVAILGTLHDIHEKVESQSKLDKAAEFHEQITAAINEMQDALVIFDADDRLLLCNDAYLKLFPETASVIKPRIQFEDMIRFSIDQGQYPDAIGREEEWIQECMQAHINPQGPIEQRLANGRWVRVHEYITSNGSRVGFRIDITEMKRLETRLTEAAKEAHSANRLKDRFLANMSHELRTPLNAIIGFSQVIEMMMQQEESDRVKIGEYATDISGAGLHLLGIIEGLFSLAQMDAEETMLNLVPLEVHALLDDTKSLTGTLARQHDKNIRIDENDCGLLRLVADKTKVTQVLVNLVSNAVKYSEDGDVMVRAEVGERDKIIIKVIDDGPGIPLNLQARIFDRFERLDATKMAIEGIGIGLAIAKDLVRAMGGSIGVDSVEGEGSTFWIALPIAEVDEQRLAG